MYESQVRPGTIGRELVARQQPKQHHPILNPYRRAIESAAYFLKSNLEIFAQRGTAALCLIMSSVAFLSGCGGINYKSSGTGAQSNSVGLSDLSCGTQSLTGPQSKACTVSLNAVALSSTTVKLSSSSAALLVPSQVTIAVGQSSASFNAVSSIVSKAVTATITGNHGGVTKTFALTLYPQQTSASTLSNFSCASQSLTGPTTTACTVTLSHAATSAVAVMLSASNNAVQIPAAVTVNSGATTAQFNVTASAVSSTQNVTLTASSGGLSQTCLLQILGTGSQTTQQHKVQLSWNPPSGTTATIVGYNVYRATGSTSNFALLTTSIDTQTNYSDAGVVSGSTYNYIVTSVDVSGVESSPSNATQVTIP